MWAGGHSRILWIGSLLLLVVGLRPAGAVCVGDCNGDGEVLINEVVAVVNIFLDTNPVASCMNADQNGDGQVLINEVVGSVNSFLDAATCPMVTGPTGTPTLPPPTPTSTLPPATPTPTPTMGGPPLGDRSFSLGDNSGFFSSLAVGKVGTPEGTLLLHAGAMDANGQATVTLANAPVVVRTDLPLGGLTLCTRLDSCTGTLYCDGGINVDVLNSLDSLASGLNCVQDGTHLCPPPAPTPSPCCSNACEGVGVGSGNSPVQTSPPPIPTPGKDSGPGAMLLICQQRSVPVEPIGDCSGADFESAAVSEQYYTTGIDTSQVLNHCAGTGAPPGRVPRLARLGTNFDCSNWTTEDGAGVLAFTIPAEEGSAAITGDGAQAGLWSDQ